MPRLDIKISVQTADLYDDAGNLVRSYRVSTSRKRGRPARKHCIRQKLPDRPPGEIYTPALAQQFPDRDWILTRILWLSGCEPKINRLGDVDTMRRYIYIHGSPDSVAIGRPGSIGCIRMNNNDLCYLFEQVSRGTSVKIRE